MKLRDRRGQVWRRSDGWTFLVVASSTNYFNHHDVLTLDDPERAHCLGTVETLVESRPKWETFDMLERIL